MTPTPRLTREQMLVAALLFIASDLNIPIIDLDTNMPLVIAGEIRDRIADLKGELAQARTEAARYRPGFRGIGE